MPIVMTPKASPVYEHFDSTCCGRGIDVKDVKSVSNSDTTQGSYKFRQIAAFITGLMAKKTMGKHLFIRNIGWKLKIKCIVTEFH
ncbi:hypothetical protein CGI04_16875 [Vibrio parahaemolyticus]|nr:hypothetical protein CGI04_16875 [Vibrio parahaemolyticus]